MRTTESNAFGDRSSEAQRKLPAALFTSWFTGPSSCSIRPKAASTASGSLTSHGVAAARPPAVRMLAATSCSASGSRPTTATRAPRAPMRNAIERPSPVPPPVTRTVLSASRSGRNGSMAPPPPASIIYRGRHASPARVSWFEASPAPAGRTDRMRHNAFDRYVSAVLLVGGALLIKLILAPLLDEPMPFLLFLGAAAAAGWRGGVGPGLLGAGLAVAASHVFFLAAGGRPAADESVRLGLFAIESVTVAFLAGLSNRRPAPARDPERD